MTQITGNIGLTIWNSIEDDFDFGQLEDNWIALDLHDHSPERGVQVPSAGIANQAITSTKLGLLSVATEHLQNGAVTTNVIANEAVGTDQIQPYSITPELIESTSLTFQQMDPTVVPLGSIMLWWRPPGSAAVPGGVWEIMDGRGWNLITNAWNLTSGNIPNMIDSFAMGTGITTGVGIGSTGGANEVSLSHYHNVDAHAHSVPAHSHTISADGVHAHTFAGGLSTWTRQNTISPYIAAVEGWPEGQSVSVDYFSMYVNGLQASGINQSAPMDAAGSHSHTGFVGNTALTTGSTGTQTDTQLGSSDITPPYVGFCYIMKVRNW